MCVRRLCVFGVHVRSVSMCSCLLLYRTSADKRTHLKSTQWEKRKMKRDMMKAAKQKQAAYFESVKAEKAVRFIDNAMQISKIKSLHSCLLSPFILAQEEALNCFYCRIRRSVGRGSRGESIGRSSKRKMR